jgi:hypothetical protein
MTLRMLPPHPQLFSPDSGGEGSLCLFARSAIETNEKKSSIRNAAGGIVVRYNSFDAYPIRQY